MKSEAYFDIVWQQFKKNKFALCSLWVLAPLFLVAIFAPVIASNQPVVFHDIEKTLVFRAAAETAVFYDLGPAQLGEEAAAAVPDDEDGVQTWQQGSRQLKYFTQQKILVRREDGETSVYQKSDKPILLAPGQSLLLSALHKPPLMLGGDEELPKLLEDDETIIACQQSQTLVYQHLRAPQILTEGVSPSQSDQTLTFKHGDQTLVYGVAGAPETLNAENPAVMLRRTATLYPWFRAIFNPEQAVDFAFNMAMIGFFPWVLAAIAANWFWKRKGVPGRQRVGLVAVLYVLVIAGLVAVCWKCRPDNRYGQRSFAEEQFQSNDEKTARYVPIPFGPIEGDLVAICQSPGYRKTKVENWEKATDGFSRFLGTDDAGSDVLVRMIYGTRLSLTVGFVAVGIYVTIGIIVGAIAGYFGGVVDICISRIIEIVLLFPSFFLILTLVALIGPSIYIIMVVIGITGWPTMARLIRGEVLKQRSIDYVAAARALGVSNRRIIFRHILPNAITPALVTAPFGIAGAIITEAGLSLLGFGVEPPAPSWGALLKQGNDNYSYWWLIVFPSLAIFLTVTVFNLVGSGLRDAMDPRLRM